MAGYEYEDETEKVTWSIVNDIKQVTEEIICSIVGSIQQVSLKMSLRMWRAGLSSYHFVFH